MRTAIPVDGRFEHIVLSCNMTSDHGILRILTESQRTIDVSSPQLHSFVDLAVGAKLKNA